MKDAIEDVIGNILNCAAGQYDIEALEQVLERIAALEAAEAENEKLRAMFERARVDANTAQHEVEELRARVAELEEALKWPGDN